MPASHSASVSSTSRTKACRWRIRLAATCRKRASACVAIFATTVSVRLASVRSRVLDTEGPPLGISGPRVIGRDLGVDVDPDRLGLGVVVHGLEPHVAAVARVADAAERRAGVDALVTVDPDHAAADGRRDPARALKVARPQPTAEAVRCAVGDGRDLVLVAEGGDGDEGAEDLFLAYAVGGLGAHDRRLEVVTLAEFLARGRATAQQHLAALVARDLDVAEYALAVLHRGERPHLGGGVQRIADPD